MIEVKDTGLDASQGSGEVRIFNTDGSANVKRAGIKFWDRFSAFHILLNMKNVSFFTLILITYGIINVIFASIYYLLGPENIGIHNTNACNMNNFYNCFFFSAQTLTTVGYGRLSPTAFSTSVVSSLESLLGLILFAIITGLCYGRFAKPKSKILFSKNALISPYDDTPTGLMVRTVLPTNHLLSEVEANFTLALMEEKDGIKKNEFYPLKLEIAKISSFVMNWTIVHPIDDESPLKNLSREKLLEQKAELLVFLRGFDEHYNAIVQKRVSYVASDFIIGAKFIPMFTRDVENNITIIEIDKLSNYKMVNV
jgi:inward rectifier potassium channel